MNHDGEESDGSRAPEPATGLPVHPDAQRPPARLPRGLVSEVFAHARECYPEECCGLLLGPPGGEPERIVRCTNVQNLRHSSGESELEATNGFWIDEVELLRALRVAERQGHELRVVYHSHVDTRAYLSQADERAALGADGRPLWPGVAQLVVSVFDGAIEEAALFDWDERLGRYAGRVLAPRP